MIITCGQCMAKFKVAPEQIKETGSKVRCSNCRHVFTVYRPGFESDDREIDPMSLFYSTEENSEGGSRREGGAPYAQTNAHFRGDDYGDERGSDGDVQYDDSDDDFYSSDYPAQKRYAAASLDDDDSLSLKERRDRRRRLYADIEEEADQGYEADEDIYYEDEDMAGEDGQPPLRRASARAAARREQAGEEYEDEVYEEDYEEEEGYEEEGEEEEYVEYDDSAYEDEDDYEIPSHSERRTSLGLAVDPVENVAGFIDDADYRGSGQGRSPDGAEIRAAVTRVSRRFPLPLIIILAIIIIVVVVGAIIFLNGRSAPTALSTGKAAVNSSTNSASGDQGLIDTEKTDNDGIKHITFTPNSQNHYWRQNDEAGQILIITGMVKNSYSEPRSFIRLRGHILASDGTSLADRFVYAGNLISEEELKTLPSSEILGRLSNKGGQNGRNMNIPSGVEIPFMVVFDKLPDGMSEYRVVPVGSSSAQ